MAGPVGPVQDVRTVSSIQLDASTHEIFSCQDFAYSRWIDPKSCSNVVLRFAKPAPPVDFNRIVQNQTRRNWR